eukprot:3935322-Rhodomonas_salina.5
MRLGRRVEGLRFGGAVALAPGGRGGGGGWAFTARVADRYHGRVCKVTGWFQGRFRREKNAGSSK